MVGLNSWQELTEATSVGLPFVCEEWVGEVALAVVSRS